MILIALGANLPSKYGSPEETLEAAKLELNFAGVKILSSSQTWLTEPVPISDQPWYRNVVVSGQTSLAPLELLTTLHAIEEKFGRVRTVRNAPRILDLDLLAYNNTVIDENDIHIPHIRMHERAFVLVPLSEITPDWKHPVLKQTALELLKRLPDKNYFNSMKCAA